MKELQYITISVLFDALIIPDLASGIPGQYTELCVPLKLPN